MRTHNQTRLFQTGTHRVDVFAGQTNIGYIHTIRMLEGFPTLRNPRTGKVVNFFVSPSDGGLQRALGLNLATAETEEEAISALRKMAGIKNGG